MSKFWTLMTVAFALSACGESVEDALDPDPIASTCEDYCMQQNTCDDEVDVDACTADCVDNMNDCQADEQEQALEELEECAAESCDDIDGCTVGAALECYFGI